jgi:hypothetical protein
MSRKGKRIALFILGIGIAFFVAAGFGMFGRPSDEEQIREALDRSIQASREGRPGGVLEHLSVNFKINEEEYRQRDIARMIREFKPRIEVREAQPVVHDTEAFLTAPVTLSVPIPALQMDLSEVNFRFEKEPARKWLIFPSTQWRLTQVTVPPEVVQEAQGRFGM